jgi:N-acetyl-alpha-D-muramate 1-phosphate uridylyltransferase
MRAMILAAGRGERMRPLTDKLPKPLLCVGGKPLIVWQIHRLLLAGFNEIVINHAWLGQAIQASLGDGSKLIEQWNLPNPKRLALHIQYSAETTALETAGGIAKALHLLLPSQSSPYFAVINGDVWCDLDYARLRQAQQLLALRQSTAWCLLVPNPEHHPEGDFSLRAGALISHTQAHQDTRFTFSGIGVYHRALFSDLAQLPNIPPTKLSPLLRAACDQANALGEVFFGDWRDIGTIERLQTLDLELRAP